MNKASGLLLLKLNFPRVESSHEMIYGVPVAAALAKYVHGQLGKQAKPMIDPFWLQHVIKPFYWTKNWLLLKKYLQIIKLLTGCLEIKFD